MKDQCVPVIVWFARMTGAAAAMPASRRRDLEDWERANIDGKVGTSDWPGWLSLIGPPPVPLDRGPLRPRRSLPTRLMAVVFARDGLMCRECGRTDDLTVDHIDPVANGGSDDPENLQTLCRSCNVRKGARV